MSVHLSRLMTQGSSKHIWPFETKLLARLKEQVKLELFTTSSNVMFSSLCGSCTDISFIIISKLTNVASISLFQEV